MKNEKNNFSRYANLRRKTGESDIEVSWNVDGTGEVSVDTGYKFLDHMITLMGWFGSFDIIVKSYSDFDAQPDDHHIVEDVAITMGKCFRKAIGEMGWGKVSGMTRFASFTLPMDETLILSAVDIYDRAFVSVDLPIFRDMCGDVSSEMIIHFFESFSLESKMVTHIKTLTPGKNQHHIFEAAFKCFGKTLFLATRIEERLLQKVPGALEN